MSETNRTTLIAVEEVTYGTTPVDDAGWFTLRPTGNTLAANYNAIVSNELRSDRQRTGQVIASNDISGQITAELSEDSFDALIAAAMASAWATDVVKIGTTKTSYTFEIYYADLDKYIAFKGVYIAGFSLNVAHGQFATITFDVVGKSVAFADTGASLVGAGSVSAADSTASMAAVDVSSIKIGGSETALLVPQYSISVNNNTRPLNDLRAAAPSDYGFGSASVEGSFDAYFADHDLVENALANTALDLDVTITLGAKSFQFDTPNARIQSGWPTVSGIDADIMPTYAFNAYRDVTLASPLAITRVTA